MSGLLLERAGERIALVEGKEVNSRRIGQGFSVVDCGTDKAIHGEEFGSNIKDLLGVICGRYFGSFEELHYRFVIKGFSGGIRHKSRSFKVTTEIEP